MYMYIIYIYTVTNNTKSIFIVYKHEDVHWNLLRAPLAIAIGIRPTAEAVMLVKEPKKTMKMLEGHLARWKR